MCAVESGPGVSGVRFPAEGITVMGSFYGYI